MFAGQHAGGPFFSRPSAMVESVGLDPRVVNPLHQSSVSFPDSGRASVPEPDAQLVQGECPGSQGFLSDVRVSA